MDPQDVAEALEDLNDVLEDALEQTERGINHVSRQLPTMSLKSDTVSPITVSPTTIIAGEGWFRRDAGSAEEPSVRTGTQTVFRVQPVGGRTGVVLVVSRRCRHWGQAWGSKAHAPLRPRVSERSECDGRGPVGGERTPGAEPQAGR